MEEIKEQTSEVRDQKSEAGGNPTVREGAERAVRLTPATMHQRRVGSGQHATEAEAVPGVAHIDITDFAKVDLRVGEVKTAERIPKADKLLLITVDIGEEKPQTIPRRHCAVLRA